MARCGCATDCLCTVTGGSCANVTGDGSLGAPYSVNVTVSPNAGNTITCEANGLYSSGGGVNTADTACIDLSGTGSLVSPLTASPVFSADAGNVIECRADGLYVPAGSAPVADDYALLNDGGLVPSVLPASGTGISTVPIEFDTILASAGITVYTTGLGPSHPWTYVEIGSPGFYYVAASVQGWGAGGPTYASDMICRTSIYVDTGGGGAAYLQAAAPLVTTAAATGNAPMVALSGILQLAAGDEVWVQFTAEDWAAPVAFPGATLTTSFPTPAYFNLMKVAV